MSSVPPFSGFDSGSVSEWASKRFRESSGGGNDKSDGEAMVFIKDWNDSSKEI